MFTQAHIHSFLCTFFVFVQYGMTALDFAKANGRSSIEATLQAIGAKQRSEL